MVFLFSAAFVIKKGRVLSLEGENADLAKVIAAIQQSASHAHTSSY